jgi:hypothetical protein
MSAYAQLLELKTEVREYFDAKKVLPKISGKRPGKKCVGKSGKGSYIAADKKCKGHYSESGKLTEEGKASAQELAGKVRQRKGLTPIDKVSPSGDTKGAKSSKGKQMETAPTKEQFKSVLEKLEAKRFDLIHGTARNATEEFFAQEELEDIDRKISRYSKRMKDLYGS